MNEKQQKECLTVALERIFAKFEFSSQPEMARAMGFSQSTLSRAMNRSNLVYLSAKNRLRVIRFLGRQCESEEELRALVEEIEWDVSEIEWEKALTYVGGDEQVLDGIPWLSEGLMVGQEEEIETLRSWMLAERKTVERVWVIRGTGGAGKTILALRMVRTREVREWYRGNVFWVDVERDGESGGIQRLARKVARRKEKGLQTEDPWSIVTKGLRGKRALVVLDGVEEQIDLNRWVDLLPQKGRLLVTTRGIGVEGARVGTRVMELTGLTTGAARELLTRGVTVDVGEDDLAWVLDGLECLPLALYIGNYVARSDGGLSGFIDDLREMGLGVLEFGDQKGENVRATFKVSCSRLNGKSQALFQGLGVFLSRFRARAVADVLGLSEGEVRRGLRQLVQVGLAKSVGPGIYRMHSLVHRYTVELGQTGEKWTEWQERLAAYYLQVAREVDMTQDLEIVGEYMAEIFHGAVCALALRNRELVKTYVRYAGAYVSLDESAALEAWRKWTADQVGKAVVALKTARFCQETGRPKRALELAREALDAADHERERVEARLLAGKALLTMGRDVEAVEELKKRVLWEQVARLDDGDDLLLQAWVVSERAQVMSGQNTGCKEYAETARARWMAGQASPERAELRLLRSVPLSDDPDEAMQALEERMGLAEKVQDQDAWLADALRCGFLLTRQGKVDQAEDVLLEADRREAEMDDARFNPWVGLLEAHVAWALGWDEEGEQAYQETAEELADVFGETVLWKVPVDEMAGETTAERAVEVWRRALRVEDPFRYVDAACRVYPVFVQLSRDELPQDEAEREKQYEAEREGLRWKGIELPDWDWFIEKEDASGAGNEAVAENNATEETH